MDLLYYILLIRTRNSSWAPTIGKNSISTKRFSKKQSSQIKHIRPTIDKKKMYKGRIRWPKCTFFFFFFLSRYLTVSRLQTSIRKVKTSEIDHVYDT